MKYRNLNQPTAWWGRPNNPTNDNSLVRYLKNGQKANAKQKAYQRYWYPCKLYGNIHNTQ